MHQIHRLFRAFKQIQPPTPRYVQTWDITRVLDYIDNQGANEGLLLPDLTRKLVFLLAAVGITRISELANLSQHPLQKLSNAWILRLSRWKKNTNYSKHRVPTLIVPYFPANKNLCPVSCLEAYIRATSPWRSPESESLFLSIMKPHNPVTKDTLGRWIRELVAAAGIDIRTFAPHSIRSATASRALKAGVSIPEILKAADWSSEHTFLKYYRRDVATNFSLSILETGK
jgi:integrase